ncbi:MAG: hypothetical protein ABIF08_00650 [Nanoarchaeota archaeon]
MKVNDFAAKICEEEGGKKQVSIAQVKEILKIIRVLIKDATETDIYKSIRSM